MQPCILGVNPWICETAAVRNMATTLLEDVLRQDANTGATCDATEAKVSDAVREMMADFQRERRSSGRGHSSTLWSLAPGLPSKADIAAGRLHVPSRVHRPSTSAPTLLAPLTGRGLSCCLEEESQRIYDRMTAVASEVTDFTIALTHEDTVHLERHREVSLKYSASHQSTAGQQWQQPQRQQSRARPLRRQRSWVIGGPSSSSLDMVDAAHSGVGLAGGPGACVAPRLWKRGFVKLRLANSLHMYRLTDEAPDHAALLAADKVYEAGASNSRPSHRAASAHCCETSLSLFTDVRPHRLCLRPVFDLW